ncbi:MAG: T9SS type A sorting domain-containing protein [Bacteroidetes bacterium]|nr:T9SS type A sorting domain-containing protein [Bacteroidota bacterium]
MMYNALEEIGYVTSDNPPNSSVNNIITLYDNGQYMTAGKTSFHNDWDGFECPDPDNIPCQHNEVYGTATHSKIIEIFDSLSVGREWALTPEDQLFVYITGFGDRIINGSSYEYRFQCYTPETQVPCYFTATKLRDVVHNIKCAQMIFVMQQNYSGGFKDILINDASAECKNRIVITATDDGSNTPGESYREIWTTCGNIDEFTFYFAAALRGYYQARWPWEWSYAVGTFPFDDPFFHWNTQGCHPHYPYPHPSDYNPDYLGNNDGYTQLIEAFNYAKYMDTWCQEGYYNQRYTIPLLPPLNVDCDHDYETPMMGVSAGFSLANLCCLNGIAGTIYPNSGLQTITGARSYLLGGNVNVQSDMQIDANTEITIGVDNAIIDIDPNSTLNVYAGLKLNGASFTSSSSTNGLRILNYNNTLDLLDVKFNSVNLLNYGSILTIRATDPLFPSKFTNCPSINSERGIVSITDCQFNNSWLKLNNWDQDSDSAHIDHCIFQNEISPQVLYDLELNQYKQYRITNNDINGGVFGLGVFWSGSTSPIKKIEYNKIYNCSQGGLRIYNSEAYIHDNKIHDNQYGMLIFDDQSNVSIAGDPSANDELHKQNIKDCSGYEIYTTNNTFPYYMKYNSIIDDDRQTGDPLLFYDNKRAGVFDVANNCWSNYAFDPHRDLKLNYGIFIPYPTWCTPDIPDPDGGDEAMYNTAVNNVDSGYYVEAMNLFQLLVETYPKSEYAKASMKAMIETESLASNDFSSLKVFYQTNDSILADTSLTQLGEVLANECDIQLHDYPDAISWYENRIQNSTDPNDSVFAIIDLGHLYTIMDTTGKRPTFIGSMPQYKPESRAKYVAYRDSLLSLLPFPKKPLKKSISDLQNGKLLQNIPNPSSSSTDFYLMLHGAKYANIKIYDTWGQLKQVIPITNLIDGTQKITINTSNLPSGIYECALTVDEKKTDIKKMVVIR